MSSAINSAKKGKIQLQFVILGKNAVFTAKLGRDLRATNKYERIH